MHGSTEIRFSVPEPAEATYVNCKHISRASFFIWISEVLKSKIESFSHCFKAQLWWKLEIHELTKVYCKSEMYMDHEKFKCCTENFLYPFALCCKVTLTQPTLPKKCPSLGMKFSGHTFSRYHWKFLQFNFFFNSKRLVTSIVFANSLASDKQ